MVRIDTRLGIDLGTTFSCISSIRGGRAPKVVPDGSAPFTPSVVWFDGSRAAVGTGANRRKQSPTESLLVREFIKNDIGCTPEGTPLYRIGGFNYGAVGYSALILRRLKLNALAHLKQEGKVPTSAGEWDVELDACITVPAKFGYAQRRETRLAGRMAGLNVLWMVNEPTAAAVTYGLTQGADRTIMVFDLGGGTLDVTFMRMERGKAKVLSTRGHSMGGRNWDELIEGYLSNRYERETGEELPPEMGFTVQRKALEAKIALTTSDRVEVDLVAPGGKQIRAVLLRPPPGGRFQLGDEERPFHFEERARGLLSQCRALCEDARQGAGVRGWGEVDDLVMAGGASRMPMIGRLLDSFIAPRTARVESPWFSYDTAISLGASLYAEHEGEITDVLSKSIGIGVLKDGKPWIKHFVRKDAPLPLGRISQSFNAQANAEIKIFEGDSDVPDESESRGELQLENPEGRVTVNLTVSRDGLLTVTAECEHTGPREIQVRGGLTHPEAWTSELEQRIRSVEMID